MCRPNCFDFTGRMLTFDEKNELVAAACHQFVHREIRSNEYLNQNRWVHTYEIAI